MRRPQLKSRLARFLAFPITCLISIWLFQTTAHHDNPIQQPIQLPSPITQVDEDLLFDDWFDGDRLLQQSYEVTRLEDTTNKTQFVVVKRNGRTIAKFDGPLHPLGNFLDFGLFDLLGQKSEELIVSITVPRGGRHFVVSLHPTFRVLFDSRDFGVGREEFYLVDIDKDGVYEICLYLTSFYGMDGLNSVSETPLPKIYFKYDSKRRKYLPANHLFPEYALRHLNAESEKETYKHHRFNVLLDYVFAGKAEEGWASFDEHYPSPDKEVMKSRIKAVLKNEPVYQYIYQRQR